MKYNEKKKTKQNQRRNKKPNKKMKKNKDFFLRKTIATKHAAHERQQRTYTNGPAHVQAP
jgi:hypothetical protein